MGHVITLGYYDRPAYNRVSLFWIGFWLWVTPLKF